MRRTLMLLLLAAAACGGGPSRGHLVVDWTFAGRSCADAGVANIRVAIANEVLTPDTFNCQESNGQINIGVDLGTYFTGDYQLTISGYDANNVVTHEQTQTVAVHQGENSYAIDVPQVAVTTGSAALTWSFDVDHKSCAAANVQKVTILVDPDSGGNGGTNAGTVPCSTMGTDGASVESITPGTHTFAILALRTLSDGDHVVYRTHNPVAGYIVVGAITDVTVSAETLP
ncbi:MAG: hypothetical protein E6J63_00680 [Deltaproteobacteria bacterium]|nr:MAG: hypothetical protein E6J63_00680 [Deltaproteobacteria bacterium]